MGFLKKLGRVGQGAIDVARSPFRAAETKKTDALTMSPEERAAQQTFLQGATQRAEGDQELQLAMQNEATRQAAGMAASQSVAATNPNLAMRAAMQAQQEGQLQAQLAGMDDRRQGQRELGDFAARARGLEAQQIMGNLQASQQSRKSGLDFIGNLGASAAKLGAGGGKAQSDKSNKENIEKLTDRVEDFLDKIDPYSFEYKDGMDKDGEFVGVMAQDLEKSEIGSEMVQDGPQGKQIDFGQGFGALLAAQSEMLRRIKEIESKL